MSWKMMKPSGRDSNRKISVISPRGPHTVSVAMVLSPDQVRGPAGLARVLPRRDGIVQAGSDAIQFLSVHIVDAVLVLWYGS